jgi:hypothetical protein
MGSGETSPTMTSVHGELMERAGSPPAPAVVLDTPFGFQENADEIVAKAMSYFRISVGRPIAPASFRSAASAAPLDLETMLSLLRRAAYVFAGPGSPSYALNQWRGSLVPAVFAEKLRDGGVLTFSSAAATTLGALALPVYEIYKVGEAPQWQPGLDLLAPVGLQLAVIPHYDNAEGGTHDTRYCYMGERRLRMLEEQLPEGMAVLGVCEHTAGIIDLGAGTVSVRGRGAVVVRRHGAEERIEAGETVSLDRLRAPTPTGRAVTPSLMSGPHQAAAPDAQPPSGNNPLTEGVAAERAAFETARGAADVDGMLAAVLRLDELVVTWLHDTLDSDDMDRARSELRGMLVRLGELARTGARDPRSVVGPYVDMALALRESAREQRRFADADAIRDSLLALGIEVRDTARGTEWVIEDGDGAV